MVRTIWGSRFIRNSTAFPIKWHFLHGWSEPCDYLVYARVYRDHVLSSRCVKGLLRLEKLAYLDQLGAKLDVDLCSADSGLMHKGVKSALRITRHKVVPTTRVLDKEGYLAQSITHEHEIFHQHFCDAFSAKSIGFSELVDEHRSAKLVRHDIAKPNHMYGMLRSSTYLVCEMRANKKKNACGEDLAVPEVLSKNAQSVAAVVHPLRLKIVPKLEPPLQWRGGMISALYKGKGLSSLVSNYRDIMLANCVGKNFSKDIRKTLLPDVRRYVVGAQYGAGLNLMAVIRLKIICTTSLWLTWLESTKSPMHLSFWTLRPPSPRW